MGVIYPELKENEKTIEEVVALEEERFRETLGRGLRLFQKTVTHLREKKEEVIPGEVAFRLYDTYGFPRDLIELLAREEGMAMDEVGFESAMRVQKEGGRLARKKTLEVEEIPFHLLHLPPTTFTGYESLEGRGRVLAVGKENQELREGEEGVIVLDRTSFYAEGGGQVADRGTMEGKGILLKVLDVKKTPEGIFLHRVRVEEGGVAPGEELDLKVDPQHRRGAEIHHTATHMLQAALREILGGHVRQAGSLVEPPRLRFDFTHYQPLTLEQWRRVEERVNEKIREGLEVQTEVMEYDTAIARGALAFFGDKYGEIVRVVEIPGFSIELCGGTHVSQTGNLGLWVIRAESGVASGVRRIEALAGPSALRYLHELEDRLKGVAERVGAPLSSLEKRVEELLKEKEALEKALKESRELEIKKKIPELLSRVKEIQGSRVLTQLLESMTMEDLQSLSDELRRQIPDLYLLLGGTQGGKGILFLSLPEGSPFHAGKIIQEIAPLCGARGGGGPRSAQAGGARPEDLARAFEHFSELLTTRKELRHA
jgi:alanyl-tRNA synthetase